MYRKPALPPYFLHIQNILGNCAINQEISHQYYKDSFQHRNQILLGETSCVNDNSELQQDRLVKEQVVNILVSLGKKKNSLSARQAKPITP